jgi:hypothetical protein
MFGKRKTVWRFDLAWASMLVFPKYPSMQVALSTTIVEKLLTQTNKIAGRRDCKSVSYADLTCISSCRAYQLTHA